MTSRIPVLMIIALLLDACSPVNSMAPFDDKQAAVVAKAMRPRHVFASVAKQSSPSAASEPDNDRNN